MERHCTVLLAQKYGGELHKNFGGPMSRGAGTTFCVRIKLLVAYTGVEGGQNRVVNMMHTG